MSKMTMMINGVWNECETVMKNGVLKVISATPITPDKEYDDFMSYPTDIKEIIFNNFLEAYCVQGSVLPEFIVRICKEKGIDFRSLKRAYKRNRTATRYKFDK